MALGNINNEYPKLELDKLSYTPSKQIMTYNHQDAPMTTPTPGERYTGNIPSDLYFFFIRFLYS